MSLHTIKRSNSSSPPPPPPTHYPVKRQIENSEDDWEKKQSHFRKITIGHKSYRITPACDNHSIINNLIKEHRINPKLESHKYHIKCDGPDTYTAGNIIGVPGGYNAIYEMKDDPTKVIRVTLNITNDVYIDESQLKIMISGFFIQSILSKSSAEGGMNCNGICKVHEFGYIERELDNGKKIRGCYAIVERLTTPDLLDYLQQNDSVTIKNKNWNKIFYQVTNALVCMHSQNYVHLDIKLENIGLNSTGDAKLFDFDFATYLSKEPISFGKPVGTREYMAPELKKTPHEVYIKSDIYSLGVVVQLTYNISKDSAESDLKKLIRNMKKPIENRISAKEVLEYFSHGLEKRSAEKRSAEKRSAEKRSKRSRSIRSPRKSKTIKKRNTI